MFGNFQPQQDKNGKSLYEIQKIALLYTYTHINIYYLIYIYWMHSGVWIKLCAPITRRKNMKKKKKINSFAYPYLNNHNEFLINNLQKKKRNFNCVNNFFLWYFLSFLVYLLYFYTLSANPTKSWKYYPGHDK